MTPALSVATDNIYKFACLFGLALIISGVYTYVSVYTSSLDRQIKYAETAIQLEAKVERSKVEDDLLALTNKLSKVTESNKKTAHYLIAGIVGAGIALSVIGAIAWTRNIQQRDDRMALLQLEKLELEVAKLRKELGPVIPATSKDEDRPPQDG